MPLSKKLKGNIVILKYKLSSLKSIQHLNMARGFLKVFICLISCTHIINSQILNICYAVNGNTSNFLPSNTLSFGPGSWCPTISNDCVWLLNDQQVTTIYSVMNAEDLRFEIDYKIDVAYSFNDYTRIYYNCDGIERLLFEVSTSRFNANINTTYFGRNNPYYLPKIYCDNVSRIFIRIEQNIFTSQQKYFNFENACIYGFIGTRSPTIITDVPSMSPSSTPTESTGIPTMTPSLPTSTPSIEPTMEPTDMTLQPTIEPTIEPTSDSRIIRNVFCGETLTGSIISFGTDFYKLINIPIATTSIQLDSCGSGYDTWLQVFDDQFRLIYEWYLIFM